MRQPFNTSSELEERNFFTASLIYTAEKKELENTRLRGIPHMLTLVAGRAKYRLA